MDPASSRSNSSFLRSYDPSSNHFASDVIIQVPKAVSMTGTDPQMACGGNWSSVDSRSSGHQDWRVMNYTSNHKPTCSTTAGEVLSNNLNNDKIVRCVNYSSGSSMQYAMRQLPSQDHQIYQTSNDTLLDVVTNSAASIRAGCDQTVPQYISNGYSGHELDLNAYHQGGLSLSLSSKAVGIQQPSTGTSTYILHGTGPLGPFTGYAAILKSSRFLKPAQDLLDEICNAGSSRHTRPCQVHKRNSGDAVLATSGVENVDCADTAYNVTAEGESTSSAVVRSTLYTFNENRSGVDGAGSSKHESYRREYKQNKAKLIFLQEEVCGRYKQYHQQMQLLASSFQSVAGLSTATPYLSFALNNVSGDFESLRHAISDQLKNVTTEQGTTDIGKDDTICCDISRLSRATFQMHNKVAVAGAGAAGSNVGILEPQQHVWRPQRGLPERAVAILRAWLFEHFLHPYPTDTDKHMLATQTGLSRNQVSNWFINARVRVWKPMVEEIHMLETKGLADKNQNPGASTEASSDRNTNRCLNKVGGTTGTRYSVGDGQQVLNVNNWNHERRSMVEVQATGGAEGSIVDLLSYQRSGIDVGGLGAVSLTLGLRHEVENANQQHNQQHQDHYRRQLGSEMIHDFVG